MGGSGIIQQLPCRIADLNIAEINLKLIEGLGLTGTKESVKVEKKSKKSKKY